MLTIFLNGRDGQPDKNIAEGGITVNWLRMVLDGLIMAAYFNLFAAAVAMYNPRLMFPCYPPSIIKEIIKDAPELPTKAEKWFYLLWCCFGEMLSLIIYGALSTLEGGTRGFGWMVLSGYIQWMMIGFADLLFLDVWLIQKKCKKRFMIPGTEEHPGNEFKVWMQGYALPEHLLQWPLVLCPVMALL